MNANGFYRQICSSRAVKLRTSYINSSGKTMIPVHDRAIWLYCHRAGSWTRLWKLLIRAPTGLVDGREGKGFIETTAVLNHEDLTALRDACDEALRDGM